MGTFVAKKLGEKLLEKIAKCNNVFKHSMGRFTRYDICRMRQAYQRLTTRLQCRVRQRKCGSVLKHVLKRYDNRKSCRRPVVSLSHAPKSHRVNRPEEVLPTTSRVQHYERQINDDDDDDDDDEGDDDDDDDDDDVVLLMIIIIGEKDDDD